MRPETFVYDSTGASDAARAARDRLDERSGGGDAEQVDSPDTVTIIDVASGADAVRDGTVALKEAIRVGRPPDELYEDGAVDFGPGALVTVDETGRKDLYVGEEVLDVLADLD